MEPKPEEARRARQTKTKTKNKTKTKTKTKTETKTGEDSVPGARDLVMLAPARGAMNRRGDFWGLIVGARGAD